MDKLWTSIHRFIDRLSIRGNGNWLQRYGFVVIIAIIFFFIKTAIIAFIGKDIPFLFALFIVIVSAWFGGFGPGIFATFLSGIITYFFFLEPKLTLTGPENFPNLFILLVFVIEGIFISALSESHRKSDIQRTEFIGVISHELKNPLTSIKGYTEMIHRLAGKNQDSKIAEFAARIDRQLNHILKMINEMLDITKIEMGRLTYTDDTFSISGLVQEIVYDQQVTTAHTIHFVSKGNNQITGDRYRIGQVITNLISNAIKYSPNAKRINVRVESRKSDVLISIQDFGPGISKEDQAKLFRPFFRAQKTQSTKGTGIGLFISKQIVQRHKGNIWVKSDTGKGATFFLSLPTKRSTKKV